MSPHLEMHPASPEELRAAHQNVYDVWSKGLSPEAHLARRLGSPHHNWARWYVGLLEGRVVTSLAAHPLELRLGGAVFPMIGIASVHTLAEFRGQGLAPRLIAWVEQFEREQGAAVSLLFSDVAPGYYARQGYTLCPAHLGRRELGSHAAAPPATRARLESFKATNGLGRMMGLWSGCHGHWSLSLERSAEYWQLLLDRRPDDDFYWLRDEGDALAGFVRITPTAGTWKICDWAVEAGQTELLAALFDATLHLALERGARQVEGWLPDWPVVRGRFSLSPRPDEITMLKWLVPHEPWSAAQIAAADALCEIDHV